MFLVLEKPLHRFGEARSYVNFCLMCSSKDDKDFLPKQCFDDQINCNRINYSYHVAVTQNTSKCLCLRTSPFGMTTTQMAMIMNRLNAADPTIVFGPKSPASKPRATTSMMDRRISGADEPGMSFLVNLLDGSLTYREP